MINNYLKKEDFREQYDAVPSVKAEADTSGSTKTTV